MILLGDLHELFEVSEDRSNDIRAETLDPSLCRAPDIRQPHPLKCLEVLCGLWLAQTGEFRDDAHGAGVPHGFRRCADAPGPRAR